VSHFHYLTRAVEQRGRAGEIKGIDPRSQAKRDFLHAMAERNEAMAEVAQRRTAGHDLGPAKRRLEDVDQRLVQLKSKLRSLGVEIRRKP